MQKFVYNSLSEFYASVQNLVGTRRFDWEKEDDRPDFRGLLLREIKASQYAYQVGVEKFNNLPEFEVQKAEWLKFYNSFDGYDIDIDRMHDGLDFLIDRRKQRKLPKTMDVFINIAENANISYDAMLMKTYTAIKIIDHLEMLGVRTAAYCCISVRPSVDEGPRPDNILLEICLKDYADAVNIGAICTAISPWMLRYWFFMWIIGRYPHISSGLGMALSIPSSERKPDAIIIDEGQCHYKSQADTFIHNIKLENIATTAW